MPCANNNTPCAPVDLTTEELHMCICCSNEKLTPEDFYELEGKIYFSENKLCPNCIIYFMSNEGQFELSTILKVREGATCCKCHQPLPEDQHGLGQTTHFHCMNKLLISEKIEKIEKLTNINKTFNSCNSQYKIYQHSNMWIAKKIK